MPKVSVIIPVYKAEPYIERCARSLFEQTLDDLEFIFVDDCSPDRSIEVMERVLDEYPARKSQVKVIRHEVNQGVSSARQHGVDAATGEYIIHCDPDDWVELNMYEAMYAEAKATDSHIVICDYLAEYCNNTIYYSQCPTNNYSITILKEITGNSKYNIIGALWNKLIIRQLYYDNKFTHDISYCEDVLILCDILRVNSRIVHIPHALYHYSQDIVHSLTKNLSPTKQINDIKLLNIINLKIENESNREYQECYESFLISVLHYRFYYPGILNNIEFNKTCSKYIHYLPSYKRYNIIIKSLLWFALKINYKISYNIFSFICKIKHSKWL